MYKVRDITIIAGLSGVGKTYIIEKLIQESDNYVHFSAGSLIQKQRAILNRDQLRKLDKSGVLANQHLIVEQFKEELKTLDKRFSVLFDAHMIIDNNQDTIEIPYEIFEQLKPIKLIFLFDEAQKIIERRMCDTLRKRPVRTISEIIKQQERSIALAQEYSHRLSIFFAQIKSGDVQALSKVIAL